MIANQIPNYISPAEYLTLEEDSLIKHEYIDGEIYAMAGASDADVTIAGNLFAMLRNHLRGSGCRVYMSDMKAFVEAADAFYYPDVMVACDARDKNIANHKKYPCLIVEFLSGTTEAFDRGEKFASYQKMQNLQEYILISQKRQRLDCFRRNREGLWVLQSYSAGSEITIESVNFKTSIDSLYEDVDFANNQGQ
ncbi:MAG: Uma2 family endonuclease [Oscillatoria sp. SIO1A7]|nr:Uma2 family endonuclease [Oscillatoria sp. SIO1A7]